MNLIKNFYERERKLEMKIGIITGASSGLGREFAYKISKYYSWLDEIWLIARRKDKLEELSRKLPIRTRIIQGDLQSEVDRKNLQLLLQERKPQVKLLVNNAGYGKIGEFSQSRPEDISGMIRLNVEALSLVTYMVLPYCHRGSRIIQVGSVAGFIPQPSMAVYAATKAYVVSFSQALARELRHKQITVTAVCPGPVATEFFQVAGGDIASFKKEFIQEASQVVEQAIRDSAKGKTISVSSLVMQGVRAIGKILPNELIFRAMDTLG